MNIAIVGYGTQGQSTFEYLNKPENQITICDLDESISIPEGVNSQLGSNYIKNLNNFDAIYRAPIVHPRDLVAANSSEILDKVTSNTNEFFRVCPSKNIIGVTGTKGKGTTSTLIAKTLEAQGKTVHLGGNIGTPPLDMLKENINPNDWVVLELANFQLIDLKHSPHVAVCLMVVPEHMDWHEDMDEYIDAKSQLFINQNSNDIAIYYANNEVSEEIASVSEGQLVPYFKQPGAHINNDKIIIDDQIICEISEIKLLGEHNSQNICAAITAVWRTGATDPVAIKSIVTSFSGLPYRLELVSEINGVQYYNDSFGTTPETAIVAFQSFAGPKIGIVGGSDKGIPFDEMAKVIANGNTKALITIGDTGPTIANLVRAQNPNIQIIEGLDDMKEIVNKAKELAENGDIVLLSCGSASFGLFKNYKDRGDQFNSAVQSLF